jgi:hypothetical protein
MPLSYDQISAITEKKFLPKMVDNIFQSNPLLKRLKEKQYTRVDGGTSIIQPLNYAQASAVEWYQGADTLTVTDNDVITGAEYSWKQIHGAITISHLDELKNNGDAAKLKLVQNKMKIVEKSVQDTMGTGLYSSGSIAKSIVGLGSIVGIANTVGGISQSSYSWWQGQVDSTTTVTTLPAIQVVNNLATVGNDGPTVGMTTRAIYNYIYALLQPQQRFVDAGEAKAGFTSIMLNGFPVLVDSHCTTAALYLLNEQYLHLYYHPQEDFRFEPFQKPINQNVKVGHIYWAGAFGSSNNRMHGVLSALAS